MQNSTLCKLDKSSAKNIINEILPIPASSSFTDEEDLLNSLHSLLVRCFQLQLRLPLLLSSFQDLLDLSGLQPLNDRILSFFFFFFSLQFPIQITRVSFWVSPMKIKIFHFINYMIFFFKTFC